MLLCAAHAPNVAAPCTVLHNGGGVGSKGFMRVHPPHMDLQHHMQLINAKRFDVVEDRPDDRLVRTWLDAKCKQDFRWC